MCSDAEKRKKKNIWTNKLERLWVFADFMSLSVATENINLVLLDSLMDWWSWREAPTGPGWTCKSGHIAVLQAAQEPSTSTFVNVDNNEAQDRGKPSNENKIYYHTMMICLNRIEARMQTYSILWGENSECARREALTRAARVDTILISHNSLATF